jgi:uncharacterized protein YlzI (FlbEa/FlbD family)
MGLELVLLTCLLGTCPSEARGEVYAVEKGTEARGSGVRFTRPDGTPIYVNPRAVAFVRAPLAGELGNATLVFSSGAKQSVSETVDAVIEAIAADMPRMTPNEHEDATPPP